MINRRKKPILLLLIISLFGICSCEHTNNTDIPGEDTDLLRYMPVSCSAYDGNRTIYTIAELTLYSIDIESGRITRLVQFSDNTSFLLSVYHMDYSDNMLVFYASQDIGVYYIEKKIYERIPIQIAPNFLAGVYVARGYAIVVENTGAIPYRYSLIRLSDRETVYSSLINYDACPGYAFCSSMNRVFFAPASSQNSSIHFMDIDFDNETITTTGSVSYQGEFKIGNDLTLSPDGSTLISCYGYVFDTNSLLQVSQLPYSGILFEYKYANNRIYAICENNILIFSDKEPYELVKIKEQTSTAKGYLRLIIYNNQVFLFYNNPYRCVGIERYPIESFGN